MRNKTIGVWMWQRLFKWYGDDEVYDMVEPYYHWLDYDEIDRGNWYWLCPKPNLVLVHEK